MRKLIAGLVSLALILLACSTGSDPEPTGDEIVVMPSGTGGSFPAKSGAPATMTVTGVLGFDDIEGGCWFVGDSGGTSYQVVYPDGWTLDRALGELQGPAGQKVRVGESLTVRGAVATDRSSTCQIGPIFVATEVEVPAP
jgi:hypothetical protein